MGCCFGHEEPRADDATIYRRQITKIKQDLHFHDDEKLDIEIVSSINSLEKHFIENTPQKKLMRFGGYQLQGDFFQLKHTLMRNINDNIDDFELDFEEMKQLGFNIEYPSDNMRAIEYKNSYEVSTRGIKGDCTICKGVIFNDSWKQFERNGKVYHKECFYTYHKFTGRKKMIVDSIIQSLTTYKGGFLSNNDSPFSRRNLRDDVKFLITVDGRALVLNQTTQCVHLIDNMLDFRDNKMIKIDFKAQQVEFTQKDRIAWTSRTVKKVINLNELTYEQRDQLALGL